MYYLTIITLLHFVHTVYLVILKFWIDGVVSFLDLHSRIDKFKQLWALIHPYPDFALFNKLYCEVTQ